jgi:hypothetical protein
MQLGMLEEKKPNIIEWELDFKDDLSEISHYLKSDVEKINNDGGTSWKPNPASSEIILNDVGVNSILREIKMWLNKNKILSWYTAEDAKLRSYNFAFFLRRLIYDNYESYGLDTEYKMSHYPMIVLSVTDVVDSAFRRAINGRTHSDLSKGHLVHQTESLSPGGNNLPAPRKKSFWRKIVGA